jgi:predicted DNA-binding transcriptional regulator AlpA
MQNVVLVMLTPEELRSLIREAVAEALAQRPPVVQQEHLPAAEYLNTKDAAALLGISRKGLEGLRARGAGPPYIRIGSAVRYRTADLPRPKK